MGTKVRTPGLYEFLQEAELLHYYNGLRNILQVHNVVQLKFVLEDDLKNIGMTKPECRRLKTFFHKYCPGNYASKLKRLLLPRREDGKGEYLLGEEAGHGYLGTRGAIKVPVQHIIQADAISIYKELGQGEFGVVQQGVWTDDDGMRHQCELQSANIQRQVTCVHATIPRILADHNSHQVAVKCLSKKRMQHNTVEFMKEYQIMQSIDHKHIVGLYGVVLDAAQIMLITELAPLRSLLECLKEPSLRTTFTVPCLADFCHQICQGMTYLESKRLIHRDLAARNILVFSKSTIKISDFGLSRALGVGKDYYQTNFNVNLKLPIAWCAPECINFLKFTSASDVWAFGVTMWEMFSYGFQPWAALTGQQILEAIDEPGGQRLEQPVHCPREHYQIMEACWKHEPSTRPTFAELLSLLEDAKPEQVQAVVAGGRGMGANLLEYHVGEIITVLDKHNVSGGGNMWTGVNTVGKVGMFVPSHTVAYLGTLPGGPVSTWNTAPPAPPQDPPQSQGLVHTASGMFQRSSLRGSKERSSKRKISRDMISGPKGEVQHTGHVGPDGCYFGDITFISGTNGTMTVTGGRLPSTGSENGFSSLSRADSDVSESAPLLAGPHHGQQEKSSAGPRMGHAIGYLRKPAEQTSTVGQEHQYQTISDEENEPFGSPLDLGPSLMDEVFSELNYDELKSRNSEPGDALKHDKHEHEDGHKYGGIVESCHKLADKMTTMTLSRRHKGKRAAFVRPIKASDEKTLESAIAMANQLASKSMHDLDKRCLDDMFSSPQISPATPNSPTKKFTFKFPGPIRHRSTSPKGGRHFSEEPNLHTDVESSLTPEARDAYNVLIDGKSEATASRDTQLATSTSHRFSLPPTSHVFMTNSRLSLFPVKETTPEEPMSLNQESLMGRNLQEAVIIKEPVSLNPIPLPPKERKLSVPTGKRHVRKNPLIIPTGAAASMARRAEEDTVDEPLAAAELSPAVDGLARHGRMFQPSNDAFEEEIACSIDALDNITDSRYTSPKSSLEHDPVSLVQYNKDHVSCEDLLDFSPKNRRGMESDEVRIMSKVLGGIPTLESKSRCIAALYATDWNVHRAIKIVKLRSIVQKPNVTDTDLKVALQMRDWDVAKSAGDLLKKFRD